MTWTDQADSSVLHPPVEFAFALPPFELVRRKSASLPVRATAYGKPLFTLSTHSCQSLCSIADTAVGGRNGRRGEQRSVLGPHAPAGTGPRIRSAQHMVRSNSCLALGTRASTARRVAGFCAGASKAGHGAPLSGARPALSGTRCCQCAWCQCAWLTRVPRPRILGVVRLDFLSIKSPGYTKKCSRREVISPGWYITFPPWKRARPAIRDTIRKRARPSCVAAAASACPTR